MDLLSLAELVVAFGVLQAASLWAMKWLLERNAKQTEQRLSVQEAHAIESDKTMLRLREELARDYVRREDWIQMAVGIDRKLDSLYASIDNIKEKLNARAA